MTNIKEGGEAHLGNLRKRNQIPVLSSQPNPSKENQQKIWMCMDFIELNKACPKYAYSFLQIDQLVDETSDHEMSSFMNAYSGYNQIKIHQRMKRTQHSTLTMKHYAIMPCPSD